MMIDLISVIVPVYNIEKYIGECIESIINQSYKNIEIIIVNDGSTDKSKEICEEFAHIDSRIVLINKPNGGLVSARKAGIQASNGKYISCVDGDDWVDSKYIENMYHEIQDTDIDIVIAGFKRDLDGNSVKILNSIETGEYSKNDIRNLIGSRIINDGKFFEFGIYSYLWNKLFRKTSIIEYQLAVPDIVFVGEDSACVYPAILNSKKIKVIDATDYNYRQRPNSMLKKETDFDLEIQTYSILYSHLCESIGSTSYPGLRESVLKQVAELISGLMIVRTGGYIEYNNKLIFSLFDNIDITKSIGIYSAGTFGQHVYRRMKYNFGVDNLSWYDPDYLQYSKHGLGVKNPANISDNMHDFVVICSLSHTYIDEISELLLQKGYKKKNIISIKNIEVDTNKIVSYL